MQDKNKLHLLNGNWSCKNLLCRIGYEFTDKLIQQLLQGMGCGLPFSYKKKRIIMMRFITTRVLSKWMAAALRDKAANQAKELCASGQCAAALPPLRKAIDFGDFPSRALKAWMLFEGREGVAKDHKGSFELVEEGASLGCHHCQGVMAECYRRGFGFVTDAARSLELARESSGKGSRYGQYVLGVLYDCGAGGVAWDCAQALALYRLAAAQNLDAAQNNLGYMYYCGQGVDQDYAEALRLWQLAAGQGHPTALYRIAECHEHGLGGVRKNKAEAIRWYWRAQAAGFTYAAKDLRRLHVCK